MASVDVTGIAAQLLAEAAKAGGDTWKHMQKSAPLYFRSYAQQLANIAELVAKGEIPPEDVEMFTQMAELQLVQGISSTSHVVLFQTQTLINGVLGVLRTSINAALPVKIL